MARERSVTTTATRGPTQAAYHHSKVIPPTCTLAGEPGRTAAIGGTARSTTSTTTAIRRAHAAISTGDYRTTTRVNRYAERRDLNNNTLDGSHGAHDRADPTRAGDHRPPRRLRVRRGRHSGEVRERGQGGCPR